jgi:hypothetical protein
LAAINSQSIVQVRRELRDFTPRAAATLRHFYGLLGLSGTMRAAHAGGSGGGDGGGGGGGGGRGGGGCRRPFVPTTNNTPLLAASVAEEKRQALIVQLRGHLAVAQSLREALRAEFITGGRERVRRRQRERQREREQRRRRRRRRLRDDVVDLVDSDPSALDDEDDDDGGSGGHDDRDGAEEEEDEDEEEPTVDELEQEVVTELRDNELAIRAFDTVVAQLEHALAQSGEQQQRDSNDDVDERERPSR